MLSKKSEYLTSFFDSNDIKPISTNKINSILKQFYHDLSDAYSHLQQIKNTIIKTQNNHITKPKTFSPSSFPREIYEHIHRHFKTETCYQFSLDSRKITLYISSENNQINQKKMDEMVNKIIMWLLILNKYASHQCSQELSIYFYMTSLEKKLPIKNKIKPQILDEIHINTAFTYTCRMKSEMVIFRKEEWFKVFIHESFHNFGLDFSDMNNENCKKMILKIFPVSSQVNLYESYTEFWAENINIMFCSFFLTREYSIETREPSIKTKTKEINKFIELFSVFIQFERIYSFFQMTKVLNYMGLTYSELINPNTHNHYLFKENTSVLSYYVIKTILMNNYVDFYIWCKTNNISGILQFTKTVKNQMEYCKFIERNYNMIQNSEKMQNIFNTISKKNRILFDNLQMTSIS
jgi:hypothetical protein